MASLERIVSVVFQGKDEISRTMQAVGRNADVMAGSVEGMAKPFANLADLILDADKALVTLSGAGLAYAYKKSVDYETALVGLNKVLDENTESLDGASAKALEFSDKYGESFTDIIGQMTQFKQAGFSLEESIGLVENALNLMTAGDVEAAQASEILVRTLKGLGEEAEFASKIVETLNWVSNNFATDVPKLGEALARSAPLAKTFGLTMQETAAILTPIIEVFQDAEMASTAFKTAMARMKDDTANVTEAFEKLGFSQEYITSRSMKSTKEILLDVASKFKDLDVNMQGVVSSALFGKEHFAKMSVVLNNMGKVAKIAGADVGEMAQALDKELATRLASSKIQIDRFINSFQNLAASIGNQFKAAATGAIGGLADLETALRKAIDKGTFDPIFNVLDDALDKIGEDFKTIAELLPEALENVDFDILGKELGGIADAVSDFFDGLDLTTAEGLAAAIQKAVNTIAGLIQVTSGIAKQWAPFFQAIAEGINQVSQLDRTTNESFGRILGAAKLVVDAGVMIAGAFFVIQQSGAQIENVFNAVIGSARFLWNALQTGFDSLAIIVVETIDRMLRWAQVVTNIPGMPEEWRQSIKESRKELISFRQAIGQHQTDQISEMMDGGAQAMRGFTGETRQAKEEIDGVHDSVRETSDEIKLIPPSEFKAVVDEPSYDKAQNDIKEKIPPETTQTVKAEAKVDTDQLKAELALVETKIKASSEIIQSKIEWDAKLNIAEVEANAEKVKAIVEGLNDAYQESTKLIGNLFGEIQGFDDSANDTQIKWRIFEQIEKENLLREQQLKIIKELAEAEIRMMEAQRKRFESDDALITFEVDGSRLHDALEYVLYEMLKWTQIRAGEEDVTALLGLTR